MSDLTSLPIFDSHLHIIDARFPLQANNGYLPDTFSATDYRARTDHLKIVGGAIVSGSFQGFDQSYLRAALAELGDSFVGVTQLPPETSDDEIIELNNDGVRALRFNLKRGGSTDVADLDTFARRVHELVGWHVELYIDSRELADIESTLAALPSVSVDHLGLRKEGLPTLLRLVERGVRIKATGFSRVDFDVAPTLRAINSANPEALMFGTDLPSTRAPTPYADRDLQLLIDTLGEARCADVLCRNAMQFYRLPANPTLPPKVTP
jgi:predicted TIM-barrel fold metal-dependent hydrolase